ncbi:MAG TPA: hypothetical protein VN830_06060 [Verrucomicrobiae bacterium]|nr:hypothetical protein [Verrucomicrobiae bacterium]
MNESQFQELGMNNLTPDQASGLLALLVANQPSFTCNKHYPESQKDELKHVHLYVESESDRSAELAGRLRTQLSAIRDVSLVYSDRDADFVVSVIAMPPHDTGGRQIGYAASVVLTQPCVYISHSGQNKGGQITRLFADHYLNVGPTQDEVASTIANTLDARAFDDIRRYHAAQLSTYENK